MATLRKACRRCTASKRKCVVQLPKCTRCAEKGLECRYDLEPLKAVAGPSVVPPRFSFSSSTCDSPGYCVMKPLRFRPSHVDPAICNPGHADGLEFVRAGCLSVPDLIRMRKPAVFVHPHLQLHDNYNHFSALLEAGTGSSREGLDRLLQIDFKAAPIREALTALQALLIYLATAFFSSRQPEEENEEKYVAVLYEWTQILITSAQTKMPRDQSLWQEWLFGESLRRTVLISYGLAMTLHSFKYGYCSNWLFLESLPFDKRPGLWMAKSPQAWIAAARVKTGEEVGERLSSFHKFAESLDGQSRNLCGDLFLNLAVEVHNGHS
ncbi:hypothetical protein GQ53DRAFT_835305 [Thozetella sp. PMI_491]|nr:hypothetical protein GQ53DRAFT_835305 [Thozetella sp. PMI_491]